MSLYPRHLPTQRATLHYYLSLCSLRLIKCRELDYPPTAQRGRIVHVLIPELMPFDVYTEEVDTPHEPRDAEHETEIEIEIARKLPHSF